MNSPQRRIGFGDELLRILQCAPLLSHAALLPLAVHADVESHRIIEGRDRVGGWFASHENGNRHGNLPPHLPSVASTALKSNSIDIEKAL